MIRWPRSLIVRILLAEFAAIAVAALLLPALLVSVLDRTTALYQDRALLDQARAIAAGLRFDDGGRRPVASAAGLPAYASAYDGRAFVVVDAGGAVRLASRYAARAPWPAAPRRMGAQPFRTGRFVGTSLPVSLGGERWWVVVTQDEGRPGAILDDVRRAFQGRYLAALIPVLLVLPLVNSLLIRRLVRVVRRVSRQASAIGANSLHERLDRADLPAEVAPLVTATNALLDRLEASFGQQAAFIADVVHELRTPLATLRVTLDGVEDDATRERLARQADRLGHVVGQLRDLAALEKMAAQALDRFDLAALAADVLVELADDALAHRHAIELVAPDAAVPVAANRVLVGLALANLVTNAVRHTPSGTSVTVSVLDDATLLVEDDGPGLAAAAPDQLTRRFWRADHRRSDSAGLGLAIVQRICAVHGAAFEIGNRPTGGAAFAIRLGARSSPDRREDHPIGQER